MHSLCENQHYASLGSINLLYQVPDNHLILITNPGRATTMTQRQSCDHDNKTPLSPNTWFDLYPLACTTHVPPKSLTPALQHASTRSKRPSNSSSALLTYVAKSSPSEKQIGSTVQLAVEIPTPRAAVYPARSCEPQAGTSISLSVCGCLKRNWMCHYTKT